MNYLDNYIGSAVSASPFQHKVGDVIKPLLDAAPLVVKGRAHGGFGAVYFVQSSDTGWMSALKTPRLDLFQSPDTLDSFTREAMIWVNLPSNALALPAYRVVRYSGIPYVHMEFVPPVTDSGASIGAILRDSRRYLEAEALSVITSQLLHLLAELEAWDPSFTHGDIKPDNILLHLADGATLDAMTANDLEIRLSDFGLSRYRNDLGTHATTAGDLRYLPPEVLLRYGWMRTQEPAVQESENAIQNEKKSQDIYAIGCTVFEMIYGRHWHTISPPLHLVVTLEGAGVTPQPLHSIRPDIGMPILELVFRCLDRFAQNRPKTFSELQGLWRAAVEESGGTQIKLTIRGTKWDTEIYSEAKDLPVYKYLANAGRSADFCLRICTLLRDAANLRAAGRFEDSDVLLHSIEQELPGFPPVLAARAHGLSLQGIGNASIELYSKAVARYLADDELRNIDRFGFGAICSSLGMLLSEMGRRDMADGAVMLAQMGVRVLPDEARSVSALGLALLLAHEVKQALKWLRKACQMDPGNRQLRMALAVGLLAARAQKSSEYKNLDLTSDEEAPALELAKRLGYRLKVLLLLTLGTNDRAHQFVGGHAASGYGTHRLCCLTRAGSRLRLWRVNSQSNGLAAALRSFSNARIWLASSPGPRVTAPPYSSRLW